jgi:dipeptidase
MTNYNLYAPVIHERYQKFEAECDERQKEMEEQYLQICKSQPIHAQEMLQKFSDDLLQRALDVTDELTEELFTRLCMDTQKTYLFHGA